MVATSLSLLVVLTQAPTADLPEEPARRPSATRALGSIGAGLLATGVMAAGALYLDSIQTCPPRTGGGGCLTGRYLVLGAMTVVSIAATALATWLVHRALEGKSGLGWTVLGAVTGGLVGAAAGILIGVAVTGRIEPVPMVIGSGVFSAVGGGLMSEVGHLREP